MGLTINTGSAPETWYVPEFRGNRGGADAFAVLIRPLTAAQAQAARERDLGARANQRNMLAAVRRHRDAVIAAQVVEVEGVASEDGRAVTTGAELASMIGKAGDASLDDLLDEIFGAIVDGSKLQEGRRPNS